MKKSIRLFIDIILILLVLYLVFIIINNKNFQIKPIETPITNIIFDDDTILINSNNKVLEYSDNKEHSEEYTNKEHSEKYTNKEYFENPLDVKSLDDIILDNMISITTPLDIKSSDKISDRYNRKLNNIPYESDLIEIRNYDIINNDNSFLFDNKDINYNNMKVIQKTNDIDSKIFNKSNKSQQLFKDSKTIAARFTKNSVINDYKSELDYYEKLRTPWWSSDAKYD